jgi:hypothetical protein
MPAKIATRPTTTMKSPLPVGLTPNCGQASGGSCNSYPATRTTPGQLTVQPNFSTPQLSNGQRVWSSYTTIHFTGLWLPWETNGVDVEVQLPVISVGPPSGLSGLTPPPPAPSNSIARILYYVPNPTSYDWAGGLEPIALPGYVEWNAPLSTLSVPVPVNGTNTSATEWDHFREFVAGALVGGAAGALVGAIQESTHRKDKVRWVPNPSPPSREMDL